MCAKKKGTFVDKEKVMQLAEIYKTVYYVREIDKLIVSIPALGSYNNASHFDRGPWGRGADIGAVYKMDDFAISRIGCCEIHVGKVKLPRCGSLITHKISKKDLIESGSICICTNHSGDCFFSYELLHFYEGVLHPVDGMSFGAYAFGEPIGKAELVCVNNTEVFGALKKEEAVEQPPTQQGSEPLREISALISKLEDVVASNGNVASVVTELKYAAQKHLPC